MLELLILYILQRRDFTMYAIHKHIIEKFGTYTTPSFGALKPALLRLEKQFCVTATKIMSEGGRLSVLYSLTKTGEKTMKKLLLEVMSKNPIQFYSDAMIKLMCSDCLNDDEKGELFNEITTKALLHKIKAQKILDSEYIETTAFQNLILNNTVKTLEEIVSLVEGLNKV